MTKCWIILVAFSAVLNLRIDAASAEDSPYQIYSRGSDIMVMTNEDQESAYSFYSDSNTEVIALGVHHRLGLVFWISKQKGGVTSYVKMATLNNEQVNPNIISNGTTLSALDVDWISDRVYWTNSNDRQIEVFDISTGTVSVFMDTDYDTSPMGIAVDPIKGWVYWSDGQQEIIQRAYMLNTRFNQVIKSRGPSCGAIKFWPIALNITSQVLYWSISCCSTLEKMAVNGTTPTIIQTTGGYVSSITYASNWLWWSEGMYVKKKDMDANTGEVVVDISSRFERFVALQVVDKSRQTNVSVGCVPACLHGVCIDPYANICNCEDPKWTGWRCESEVLPADIEKQIIKFPVSVPLLGSGITASLATTAKPKVSITPTPSVQNRPVQQTRTASTVQVTTSSSKLVRIGTTTSLIKPGPTRTTSAQSVVGSSGVKTPSLSSIASMLPRATPQQTPRATPLQTPRATPLQIPGATPLQTPRATPQQTPRATPSTVLSSMPQQATVTSSQFYGIIASSAVPSGDSAVATRLKIPETLAPLSISMATAIEAIGTATVSSSAAEAIIPSTTAIKFSEHASLTAITAPEYSSSPVLYSISTSSPSSSTALTSSPEPSTSSPAPITSSPAPSSTPSSPPAAFTTGIALTSAPYASTMSKMTSQPSGKTSLFLSSKTTSCRGETPCVSIIQNKIAQSNLKLTSLAISLAIVFVTAIMLMLISILLTMYCVKQRRFLKLRHVTIEPDEIFPSNKTVYNPVYISPDVINPTYMHPGLSPIH